MARDRMASDRQDFTAPSLMRMSAPARLAIAAALVMLTWIVVAWAVS